MGDHGTLGQLFVWLTVPLCLPEPYTQLDHFYVIMGCCWVCLTFKFWGCRVDDLITLLLTSAGWPLQNRTGHSHQPCVSSLKKAVVSVSDAVLERASLVASDMHSCVRSLTWQIDFFLSLPGRKIRSILWSREKDTLQLGLCYFPSAWPSFVWRGSVQSAMLVLYIHGVIVTGSDKQLSGDFGNFFYVFQEAKDQLK